MKFYETHFEEYTTKAKTENLHPKLDKMFSKFPATLSNLKNLIFYGPSGVGKYTQMLQSIQKYSPTNLKYEKKISVTYNKQQYFFKISDIHYEVDMSLLGCNSKLLTVYPQNPTRQGLLCVRTIMRYTVNCSITFIVTCRRTTPYQLI